MDILPKKRLLTTVYMTGVVCLCYMFYYVSKSSLLHNSDVAIRLSKLAWSDLPSFPEADYLAYQSERLLKHDFEEQDIARRIGMRRNGSDVIVFLRMQKTGSTTMALHLWNGLNLRSCNCKGDEDCLKQCKSTILLKCGNGHWPCGLHADWTILKSCAEKHMNTRMGDTIKRR